MAAALGMIAGCQKPEMVQIAAPEDVVAPVLEAVEGPIEITPSNMVDGKVVFTWSLADFGVMTQVNYSLEAATAANPDTKVTITSGITANAEALEAGKISTEIAYEALNAILFNDLKLNDGVAEDVLFTIAAKVGEYECVYTIINYVKNNALFGANLDDCCEMYEKFGVSENNKFYTTDENPFFADPTHGDYTVIGRDNVISEEYTFDFSRVGLQ